MTAAESEHLVEHLRETYWRAPAWVDANGGAACKPSAGVGSDLQRAWCALARMGFRPHTVVDVGAHVGQWTRTHRAVFPDAAFVLVDANARHRAAWTDLLAGDGDSGGGGGSSTVRAFNALLADTDGATKLWYASGSEYAADCTGDSLYREVTAAYSTTADGAIAEAAAPRGTTTLDALLTQAGVLSSDGGGSTPFLVKLDVQGAELDVLRGAPLALAQADVLLLEVPFGGRYNQGAPNLAACLSFLDAAGWEPFDLVQTHRAWHELLVQVDAVFVRKGGRFARQVQESIELISEYNEGAPGIGIDV